MSTTRKARATANQATETATAAMNDGIERMTQGLTNLGSVGQENLEALIECATTVAKGFEKIATENADFAKKQMETGTDRFQAISKAKTPQEFFEAQSELMRGAFETQIGQMNKMSDMWIATARDAAQPLSKRYSALVELMQNR